MKKTTLSSLAVILFTAAIAAVNNHLIAQPQNNRLDNLKRKYSYEVCRQFIHYSYKTTSEVIPIVKYFPTYYVSSNRSDSCILPAYTQLGYDYGGGYNVMPASGNNFDSLMICRAKVDSVLDSIYNILMSYDDYRLIVQQINENDLDREEGLKWLANIEREIRNKYHTDQELVEKHKINWINDPKSNVDIPSRTIRFRNKVPNNTKLFASEGGSTSTQSSYSQIGGNHDPMRPIGMTCKIQTTSYLTTHWKYLRQANLASLRVILDDHIRRGVPIDISWIPEQALADIEATKPVRQLKKQIRTIEKQTKALYN